MIPKKLLAALVALLVALAGVVTVTSTNDDGGGDVVKVTVDTLDASPDADKTILVPKAAVEQAADGLEAGDAEDVEARDETPEDVPAEALADNAEALARNRVTTEALPTAGASGGFAGCETSFVRNQSSRRGVRPTIQVLHYTVSPNRPGRSDVNGIVAFFDRASTQASSNFVIDAEGNCAYIVPIESKAWTQGGGNPWAISYEIINRGNESTFMQPAGYAKLRSVMREVSSRTGIPMKPGRISGCAPAVSGVVQHRDGGSCWGGHSDVGPFSFEAILKQLLSGSTTSQLVSLKGLTPSERKASACLQRERRVRDRRGDWSKVAPSHLSRARGCKRDLERRISTLHRRGLSTASRRSRHKTLHAVVKG